MIGSSIIVSILTVFVGLVSLVNQLVMARLFGTSMNMDAYLIGVSIPMFVSGVLSAALSYSLVPVLISYKSDGRKYRRFSGLLLVGLVATSTVITVAGLLLTPTQIEILGHSLSFEAKQGAILIGRISWVTGWFALVVGHLSAMHNVAGRFVLPVVASGLPFVGMILSGIGFGETYGPPAVAWGMFAGSLLVIPVLLIRTFQSLDLSAQCLQLWKSVAGYLSCLPRIALAMLCFTVYQSVDSYWAPRVGTGNLAYLSYTQRVLVGIGSLIIAGPAAVLLPRLASAFADGRINDLLNDTGRAVRTVIVVALPIAVFVGMLATPVVQLLFERGAFDQRATQGVAAILPLMMVGMTAMLGVVIVFRALFSKHDTMHASMLGILATALYFVLSGVLSQRFGVTGIAVAYAASWWLVLLLSILSLWRGNTRMLFCRGNLRFIGQLVAICSVTGVVVAGGRSLVGGAEVPIGMLVLQLGIMAVLVSMVYLMVAIRFLRVEEIRSIYLCLYPKLEVFIPRLAKRSL